MYFTLWIIQTIVLVTTRYSLEEEKVKESRRTRGRPGHLFEALVSQAQLSIFIQITPVLLVTGVHQAEDGKTETETEKEGKRQKQTVRNSAEK